MMTRRAPLNGAWADRYIYTADDERIGSFVDNEYNWEIRDVDGKVLSRFHTPSGYDMTGEWEWTEDYYYENGKMVESRGKNGWISARSDRHYHLDHLGTPRLVTDGDHYQSALHTYYPFGLEQTPVNQEWVEWGVDPDPMQFTGHERDFVSAKDNVHTYIDYMHGRHYNPAWGRFVSVDPGRDWDVAQPQSWNMYSYVRDNPINHSDPTGRCFDFTTCALAFAGSGSGGTGLTLAGGSAGAAAGSSTVLATAGTAGLIAGSFGAGYLAGRGIGHIPVGSGETVDTVVQAGFEGLIVLSSRVKQLGDRAKEGSVDDAIDQLDSIRDRQTKIRKGQGPGIIEDTGKSEQRVKTKLKNIKNYKDAENDAKDADDVEDNAKKNSSGKK